MLKGAPAWKKYTTGGSGSSEKRKGPKNWYFLGLSLKQWNIFLHKNFQMNEANELESANE